ncbi:hypothetical protein M436DRAFT_49918 [Aureobasidium namibiae CBS 147.97]|uniref:Uncharacterized protein n=1 Tax=Aureobasidium namibiae CBS 147.97 TaxID=1043004 RepID=A0A074WGD3_9PEZI|nr:uncharacterized protein M436DRAFT_49918 [Aureobasidium namibiae CBS 147.97]KEQ72110.1 hypothetical protein M436DRAFT_49918 [Aureobasidium namibiae CBS 147.97]
MQSPRLFSSCRINYLPTAVEYARIKADPEKYEQYLLREATRQRNRYWQNPEFRRRTKEKSRLRKVGYRNTREPYARRTVLYNWVFRYTWFRDLPWKSHRPLLYNQGIKHTCSSCGMSRNNGSKLWWTDPGTFTCHTCYTKASWDEVMPEGYGDCRTIADVIARRAQLGGSPP